MLALSAVYCDILSNSVFFMVVPLPSNVAPVQVRLKQYHLVNEM